MKNKKGQEMNFILFLSIFLVFMTIIGSIFVKDLINETYPNELTMLGLENLPILSNIFDFFEMVVTFSYLHDYLALFFGAFFGVPLTYIIIRLIRGGG